MSENPRIDAPEIKTAYKRPIIPRAERARRSLAWWLQSAAVEGWDKFPEFEQFQKSAFNLLKAIDGRQK